MPFGKDQDFEFNPHFLHGGVATKKPDYMTYSPQGCTGPVQQGGQQFEGRTGLFITATVLPAGQYHRFQVQTDPKNAAFNFTSEATSLIGCITPPNYPERPFNQGNVGRIFVFAGSFRTGGPACFNPDIYRPIRGCPTAYGWYIEVDSASTGNYDMVVLFFQGP